MSEEENKPKRRRGWLRVPEISAAVGALFWIVGDVLFLRDLEGKGWADGLLLLAVLVIVPLALRLAAIRDEDGKLPKSWMRAILLQPPAAVALVLSYTLDAGWQAGSWSLLWLLFTLQAALFGIARLRQTGLFPMHELSVNAGFVFLAVGGVWTVLARFGAHPLGFDDVIVLLTAIHFHYAGLALPLFTGLAVRAAPSFLGRVAIAGVLVGVPLVAVGITVAQLGGGRLLEACAAGVASVSAWIVAWLHIQLAVSGAGSTWPVDCGGSRRSRSPPEWPSRRPTECANTCPPIGSTFRPCARSTAPSKELGSAPWAPSPGGCSSASPPARAGASVSARCAARRPHRRVPAGPGRCRCLRRLGRRKSRPGRSKSDRRKPPAGRSATG